MAVERDSSPYGSQTLLGPGWPNVDEEQLTAAAASYQKIAAKISGTVVPQQTSQLSKLQGGWEGTASLAASGEATSMIGGHETNGLQAQAISTALMADMEKTAAGWDGGVTIASAGSLSTL